MDGCGEVVLVGRVARGTIVHTEKVVATFLEAILTSQISITSLNSGDGPIGGFGGAVRDMASL